MFSVEFRKRIRTALIEKARTDPSVVAAATIGATPTGGDRWSDIDLTFGVSPKSRVARVLTDWTRAMVDEYDAVVLFDVPVHSTTYRVFLLPGALQVDLSFTPAAEFGARGPRFQLLFGETVEIAWAVPPSLEHRFGIAVHHVVRAHICIERGKLWQAEHWIHELRFETMTLACARLGLDVHYGRGFDLLPPEVTEPLRGSLARDLTEQELRRALAAAAERLLVESGEMPRLMEQIQPMLQEMLHSIL